MDRWGFQQGAFVTLAHAITPSPIHAAPPVGTRGQICWIDLDGLYVVKFQDHDSTYTLPGGYLALAEPPAPERDA